MSSAVFLDMPSEVIFSVLLNLDPIDVAAMGTCCRSLRDYTAPANIALWKALFLQLFDSPEEVGGPGRAVSQLPC